MAIEILRLIGITALTVVVGILAICAFMMANALTDEYRGWEPEDTEDDEESNETENQ